MSLEMVDNLVKRYNMSVAQAMETLCCCGKNSGEKMRELPFIEISWFAERVTSTKNSAEFRNCVKAARIIRAYIQDSVRKRKAVEKDPRYIDSAGMCRAKCLSCAREFSIRTLVFDRKSRPKCFECGGTLERLSLAPITEWVDANKASELLEISKRDVLSLCRTGLIKAEKHRGRWLISYDSVVMYLNFGDPLKGKMVCRYCQKTFRSLTALKLHVDEMHEQEFDASP